MLKASELGFTKEEGLMVKKMLTFGKNAKVVYLGPQLPIKVKPEVIIPIRSIYAVGGTKSRSTKKQSWKRTTHT